MKFLIAGGAIWLLPLMLFPQISYLSGWPQTVQAPTGRPIYIADIDDDGNNELLMMAIGNNFQNAMLYAFKSNGTIMPGFPITMGYVFEGEPALFDSNDDGTLEIGVAQDRNLYLRNYQGSALWTIPYNGPVFQSKYHPFHVSVDDLDNDGNQEIIATCYAGGAVFVFDAQGNVRSGWPVILPPGCAFCSPPLIITPGSIGDIDGDGSKEIVVALAGTHALYCFKPDGSYCPGFPVDTINVNNGQPALVDVDGDGYLEIIFVNSSYFHIFRYDGTPHPGFPVFGYTAVSGPSIHFSNGKFIVGVSAGAFLTYDTFLFGLDPFGALPGWPNTTVGWNFSSTPLFADIDAAQKQEVITGAYSSAFVSDGRLHAYHADGSGVVGFPSSLLSHRGLFETGVVNDLNGDGNTDICYGSTNYEFSTPRPSTVYCWSTGYPYNLDNVDWAMDGFDLGHTGRWRKLFHINKISSTLDVEGCTPTNPCYLPPDGSLIAVDVTAVRQFGGANPTGQDVRYSRTLGCGNYEGPVIDNGDGTYTRMLRAPLADCMTDVHAWVNEFKLQDYQHIIFTTDCVGPPPAFSLLSPSNHAANQTLSVTLDWSDAGLPPNPNQATTYDLYFGPTPTPPLNASGLAGTQQAVSGLSMNTTYFWKVIAHNACGSTSSALWSFTTIPCTLPPRPFNYLSPSNGATAQPLTVDLTWQTSAQASSYSVYLGTAPDALALVAAVSGTRYAVSGLCPSTTYYWQVIARNSCGNRPGAVWSFTTGADDEPHHPRPVSPP